MAEQQRVVAFIPVSLSLKESSEHFYFEELGSRLLIEWVIHHLRKVKSLDEVLLCTTFESEDLRFRALAQKWDLNCHRFKVDVDDVTGRLCASARFMKADICILVNPLSPLLPSALIDRQVTMLKANPNSGMILAQDEAGQDTDLNQYFWVSYRDVWERANRLTLDKALRKKAFSIVQTREKEFSDMPALRYREKESRDLSRVLTLVETEKELRVLRGLFHDLRKIGRAFTVENALHLLDVGSLALRDIEIGKEEISLTEKILASHKEAKKLVKDKVKR